MPARHEFCLVLFFSVNYISIPNLLPWITMYLRGYFPRIATRVIPCNKYSSVSGIMGYIVITLQCQGQVASDFPGLSTRVEKLSVAVVRLGTPKQVTGKSTSQASLKLQ